MYALCSYALYSLLEIAVVNMLLTMGHDYALSYDTRFYNQTGANFYRRFKVEHWHNLREICLKLLATVYNTLRDKIRDFL